MVKEEEDYDEDFNYDEDEKDEDINLDNENSAQNIDKSNSIDRIFNTEVLLNHIKMTMLGWRIEGNRYRNTGKGVATTETIDKMINSLRGIINSPSIMSYKTDNEINYILLEHCKEQVFRIYDDGSIDEGDVEHVVNMLDHPAEMFMGVIKSGDGAESARQIFTGNYARLNEKEMGNQPAFSVGTDNYDLFSVGRKR